MSRRTPFDPPAGARRGLLAALAVATLLASGCGYALVGRATNIPSDIHNVYLSPFENHTERQQVDQYVTEAIATEMVKRRQFNMVSDESTADADLTGSVVGFGLTPVTFDSQGRATEYEISVTASVAFKRRPSGEVVWKNDHYQFRETYEVDTSEAGFLDREEQAIKDAAQRFAETMVSDLVEGF